MPKHKTYISRNNLGSKHSLVMKFGQFMSYYKKKNSSKSSTKTAVRKLVLGPFLFGRN